MSMLYVVLSSMSILEVVWNNLHHEYILCEDTSNKLECCQECSIQILEATYGRTNCTVCGHKTVSNSTKYNYTNNASTKVSNACDGQQECLLKPTNALYDDPLPGVFKYLNVTYECLHKEITTEKTSANFDLNTPHTKTDPLAYTKITTQETPANIDPTTPGTDIDPLSCRCPCSLVGQNKWGYLRDLNLSFAQLEEILKLDLDILQKLIAINKTNTTMNLRTKYSAADDRFSAVSIGYVGATIICLVLAVFVVMDLIGYCR
ncbi:Hypothetical predicted protein [Mytilus galloprovincialis]|uniref:SUEL-type lectin domain-containing protein n=1 Tax=Mytilus galloprovincialis TaxID=29158 RepID=A0A8B6CM80_MYTGA|nr:Hypothetical predicted protein [Mytilus galloprovincialis]